MGKDSLGDSQPSEEGEKRKYKGVHGRKLEAGDGMVKTVKGDICTCIAVRYISECIFPARPRETDKTSADPANHRILFF